MYKVPHCDFPILISISIVNSGNHGGTPVWFFLLIKQKEKYTNRNLCHKCLGW